MEEIEVDHSRDLGGHRIHLDRRLGVLGRVHCRGDEKGDDGAGKGSWTKGDMKECLGG